MSGWIPLHGRNGIRDWALVDQEDFERLNQHRWHLCKGYAHRFTYPNGRRKGVWMHREVLGLVDLSLETDHINHDRLDNRRANLRACTHAENHQNSPAKKKRKAPRPSRFRGVYWNKEQRIWMARHRVNGRNYYLGRFHDEVAAAQVAEAFRREHMPFAQPDPALQEALEQAA